MKNLILSLLVLAMFTLITTGCFAAPLTNYDSASTSDSDESYDESEINLEISVPETHYLYSISLVSMNNGNVQSERVLFCSLPTTPCDHGYSNKSLQLAIDPNLDYTISATFYKIPQRGYFDNADINLRGIRFSSYEIEFMSEQTNVVEESITMSGVELIESIGIVLDMNGFMVHLSEV